MFGVRICCKCFITKIHIKGMKHVITFNFLTLLFVFVSVVFIFSFHTRTSTTKVNRYSNKFLTVYIDFRGKNQMLAGLIAYTLDTKLTEEQANSAYFFLNPLLTCKFPQTQNVNKTKYLRFYFSHHIHIMKYIGKHKLIQQSHVSQASRRHSLNCNECLLDQF